MKILKSLALSLLGFLLFLSLSLFSLTFTLNNTLLKPDFVTSELNKLNISQLAAELFSQQIPEERLRTALVTSITNLEPPVKEQVNAAIYSTYDYLFGKDQNLDLVLMLNNTILNRKFVASLVDKLDIAPLAQEIISRQLAGKIPPEVEPLVKQHLGDALSAAEPGLKQQIAAATGPILDYLLGERQSFSVTISLEAVKVSLRDKLRQAFLESPPAELAQLPPAMRQSYFDQLYGGLSQEMLPPFEFNESSLGTKTPAQIAELLTVAEQVLEKTRVFVGLFQLIYQASIALMILLVLGIVFISRQVKDISRRLGTTFLSYGAFQYAGIFIAKYFAERQTLQPGIPTSLQVWLSQFLNDLQAPLETFSLSLLIAGLVLIIISFVYKPAQSSS